MGASRIGVFCAAGLLIAVSSAACSSTRKKDTGVEEDAASTDAVVHKDAAADARPDAEAPDVPENDGGMADTGTPDGGPGMASLMAEEQTFDFGPATVGTQGMSHVFSFKNTGTTGTGPLQTLVMGIDRGSFMIVTNMCSGHSIEPNLTCGVEVSFLPTASGPLQATLTVQGMPGGAASVMITGTGRSPPRLDITPISHDYMTTPIGMPVTQDFVVHNGGDLISGSLSVALTGANVADFSITSDGCTGMTLAAGAMCTVTAALSPMSTGAKNGTLQVNAMPGGTALAQLTGFAIQGARLGVNPPQLNFGNAVVNAQGNTLSLLAQNTGATVSGVLTATITAGGDASSFAITADTCSHRTLMMSSACMLTVAFSPVSLGGKVGQLTLTGMPGGTVYVALNGAGVPAMPITITPAMRSLGMTPNGTMGAPVMFLVNNPNPSSTGVLTATVTGPNAAEFAINGDNCSGMRLGRQAGCAIGVSFNPATIGNKNATLIVTGTGGENASSSLSGVSVPPPALTFTVSAYSFGQRDVRTTSTYRIYLRNNGSGTTGPASVTIMGSADFTLVNNTCTAVLLGPGQACSVDVSFMPTSGGTRNATISGAAVPGGAASMTVDGIGNDQFTLNVMTMGSGGGTVTGSGISCTPTCTSHYTDGTTVMLTATPDNVSSFTGWGGACTGTGPCAVTMNQARNVTATFDLRNFAVNVTVDAVGGAGGTVTSMPMGIACGPTCSQSFLARTRVVLTASAAQGMAFQGWGGDCAGIAPTCAVTLMQDANVTATFTPFNVAFVTRASFVPGQVAGLGGADAACAAAAASANLPGTYRAWLSTSTVSAVQRLTTLTPQPRGWVRVDGLPFVDTLAALMAGEVLWPLRVSENGTAFTAETDVLTGTSGDGSGVPNLNCGDWRQTTGTFIFGDATAGTESWTSFGSASCAAPGYHLYCFGTSYTAPLVPRRASGRIAFISDAQFNPSLGIAAADALCAGEAMRSMLPGTYRALLSTSNASALSRFDLTGAPWVRPDGIPVVSHAADLATGPLTAIAVRANGTYLGRGFAWTGVATGPSSASTIALTCRDWTSNSASDQGTVGYETTTDPGAWDAFGQEPCSYQLGHLYCLEE